jgi:hypothetical protein
MRNLLFLLFGAVLILSWACGTTLSNKSTPVVYAKAGQTIGASGYLVGEGSRSNPPQWK